MSRFFPPQTFRSNTPQASRKIQLPHVDADAIGSVVEYLYTGEYFPKRTSSARDAPPEKDPRLSATDDTGLGLLVHARMYTLANRLGLSELKSLAHSKIHRTASTAKGELAYARFVYKKSNPRTRRSGSQSRHFGLRAASVCATMRSQSSRACVWRSHSLRMMCCNWFWVSRRRGGGAMTMRRRRAGRARVLCQGQRGRGRESARRRAGVRGVILRFMGEDVLGFSLETFGRGLRSSSARWRAVLHCFFPKQKRQEVESQNHQHHIILAIIHCWGYSRGM